MTMRREIADLSVRFGAEGTRALKADIQAVGTAIGKLRDVSFRVVGGIGKLGAGISAGAMAGVGALTALAGANAEYVDQIDRLSNLTGIQIEAMSRLSAAARRYGVDVDDLRGAMAQFIGQVAEGANGASVAEDFERIGISAQFLKDNLGDPLRILLAVAQAQTQIRGAERTGILSRLFGEDDSVKMATFLDALGNGSEQIVTSIENIDGAGAVVTPEDVELSAQWAESLGQLGDIFRGLSLEIGRTVLPTISKLVDGFAAFMRENREFIAARIEAAWRRVGYALQDIIDLFEHGESAIKGSWLEPIVRWMREIGDTVNIAIRGVDQFFRALSGYETTDGYDWIDDFAAGVVQLAGNTVNSIDGIGGGIQTFIGEVIPVLGELPKAVKAGEEAWAAFSNGFTDGAGMGFLAEAGRQMRSLWEFSVGLKEAIVDLATGQPVDPAFSWVENTATSVQTLIGALGQLATDVLAITGFLITEFGNIRTEIEQTFGIDITQLALWGALAQFSGVADLVILAGAGMIGIFGLGVTALAVFGGALGFVIAKLAETVSWLDFLNEPFRAWDRIIRWATGKTAEDEARMQEMRDQGEAHLQARAEREGFSNVEEMLEAYQNGNAPQIPAAPPLPAPPPPPAPEFDANDLLEQARAFASGSAVTDALAFATTMQDVSAMREMATGAASGIEGQPSGVPVVIQLTPTGEETTVYAPDQATADQIVDMVNRARRSQATQNPPAYARS